MTTNPVAKTGLFTTPVVAILGCLVNMACKPAEFPLIEQHKAEERASNAKAKTRHQYQAKPSDIRVGATLVTFSENSSVRSIACSPSQAGHSLTTKAFHLMMNEISRDEGSTAADDAATKAYEDAVTVTKTLPLGSRVPVKVLKVASGMVKIMVVNYEFPSGTTADLNGASSAYLARKGFSESELGSVGQSSLEMKQVRSIRKSASLGCWVGPEDLGVTQ